VSTEVKNDLVEGKYNERRFKKENEKNMRSKTCDCDRSKIAWRTLLGWGML
jgi:hypothetical protein